VPGKTKPVTGFFHAGENTENHVTRRAEAGTYGRTFNSILVSPTMKTSSSLFRSGILVLTIAATLAIAPATSRAAAPALVDDFSVADHTANGASRLLIDDKGAGSHSHATQRCEKGILIVEGELVPGRGAPAFISIPLLLTPDAKPQDLSAYEGVRLRVKLIQGILSVQVSSADVQNLDYHSGVVAGKHGEFVEVRLPFKDLKRAWSEQTPLNVKNVTSLNLVSFAMAATPFAYEIDEIGFY
jgi:hypothetical protein